MTSKAPPILPDQRSHAADKAHIEGTHADRRDASTGAQSGAPGDADVNLRSQGRHGNIHQNTRTKGYQQDR